jgi:hypothetical protein
MSLLYQWFTHGSVYTALNEKIFTLQEVLDGFLEHRSTLEESQIISCIIALVTSYPCSYLYPSSGIHLLSYFSDQPIIKYIFLYIYSTEMYDVFVEKESVTSPILMYFVLEEIIKMKSEERIEELELAKSLLGLNPNIYIATVPWFNRVVTENRTPLPISFSMEECNRWAIETDWFDEYPSDVLPYMDVLIGRLTSIPHLYLQSIYPQFKKKLEEVNLYGITRTHGIQLCHFFPELFGKHTFEVKEEWFPFCCLPLPIQSYMLGWNPLDPPSIQEMDNQLMVLNEIGVEKYKELYLDNSIVSAINDKNTLFDEIKDYLPWDVYRLEQQGKIFQFTRQEFPDLIEKKLNYWNKCKISNWHIQTLKIRCFAAQTFQLPHAETFLDLHEKCKQGIFFEKKEEDTINQLPLPGSASVPLTSTSSTNLFSTLMYLTNLNFSAL